MECVLSNYSDKDPISLDEIKEIPTQNLFLTSAEYGRCNGGRVEGYDAQMWLKHIVNDKQRRHPLTRIRLDNETIWNCFLVYRSSLDTVDARSDELVRLCMTKKIEADCKDTEKIVRITPISPLWGIHIRRLQNLPRTGSEEKEIKDGGPRKKHFLLSYCLCDSRHASVMVNANVMTVEISIPLGYVIAVTM